METTLSASMACIKLELIKELQLAGIRYYVGHEYFGCASYADDVTLLCLSIKDYNR